MLFSSPRLPNYFFSQRGPYAKEGWDYSQVADVISAHAAPGDCLMVDNTVPWKPGPVRALLAAPRGVPIADRCGAWLLRAQGRRLVGRPRRGVADDGQISTSVRRCGPSPTGTSRCPIIKPGIRCHQEKRSGAHRRINSPATSGSALSSGGSSTTRRWSSQRGERRSSRVARWEAMKPTAASSVNTVNNHRAASRSAPSAIFTTTPAKPGAEGRGNHLHGVDRGRRRAPLSAGSSTHSMARTARCGQAIPMPIPATSNATAQSTMTPMARWHAE